MQSRNLLPGGRLRWLLAIAVGCLAVLLIREWLAPNEPVYQGRKLSSWMAEFGRDSWLGPPEGHEALRAMGTNAIPYLLRELNEKDSWVEIQLTRLLANQSWFNVELEPAVVTQHRALGGLHVLGADAAMAIPDVSRMWDDPEKRSVTGKALFLMGTNSVPALVEACGHPDPRARKYAAYVLCKLTGEGGYSTEYIPAGSQTPVNRFGFVLLPSDQEALIENLGHPDARVRRATAEALGERSGMKTSLDPISALEGLLDDEDLVVREAAREALAEARLRRPEG